MAATPPMSFIPSEDIELSEEERITLAQARWNEATAANENPSKAKLARQHDIPKSTLTDRINGRKAASVGVCPGPCTFRSRAHPKPD